LRETLLYVFESERNQTPSPAMAISSGDSSIFPSYAIPSIAD
jgi:hypothetical protein